MGLDAAAYLGQLRALMPVGVAWNTDDGTEQRAVLAAIASGLARIDARGTDLLREMHPAAAVELLPEWEAQYAVPVIPGATIEQRQIIVAWYHSHGGDIKQPHFVALASLLGYTIRIEEYCYPVIGYFCVGDPLYYEQWQDFTAGVGGAGDTLGMPASPAILPACWRVVIVTTPAAVPAPNLETILQGLRPAHIHLNFDYPEA